MGKIEKADNYFGSFIRIEVCNNSGEVAYFRLLYCDWEISKDQHNLLNSSTCSSNDQNSLRFLLGKSINCFEIVENREAQFELDDGLTIIFKPNLVDYEADDELATFVIDNIVYSLSSEFRLDEEPLETTH